MENQYISEFDSCVICGNGIQLGLRICDGCCDLYRLSRD